VTDFLEEVLTGLIGLLLRAWLLMVILGAFHHDISAHVPALGYWWTFLLLWGTDTVLGAPVRFGVRFALRDAGVRP
jgi:hypothetical protein